MWALGASNPVLWYNRVGMGRIPVSVGALGFFPPAGTGCPASCQRRLTWVKTIGFISGLLQLHHLGISPVVLWQICCFPMLFPHCSLLAEIVPVTTKFPSTEWLRVLMYMGNPCFKCSCNINYCVPVCMCVLARWSNQQHTRVFLTLARRGLGAQRGSRGASSLRALQYRLQRALLQAF